MKKTLFATSCLAIAMTNFSCYAYDLNIKPFVGGNIALNTVSYSKNTLDAAAYAGWTLPISFFSLGLEAGAKLAGDGIYNMGLTFAYDYMFDSNATLNPNIQQIVSSVKIGYSAVSLTFDNYIRIEEKDGKRTDIVLGIGAAQIKERFKMLSTQLGKDYGLYDMDAADSASALVLKLGSNFQISSNADFYANMRIFIPTANGDISSMLNISTGMRFLF